MSKLLEAALRYAAHGWQIFPVQPGGKTPITPHGCRDATTDESKIRSWWARWPDANVAVACGALSGFYAVDVDVNEDGTGEDGYKSLADLPTLPKTVMQHTPRGGCHVLYRSDDPVKNQNGFLPGVDIRCDGYYILLSPSVRADGKQYAWAAGCEPWETPLAEFPDYLRPTQRVAKTPDPLPPIVRKGPVDDSLRRASLYLAECDAAVQGANGHNALFWACGAMTWGCEMSENAAYDILANEYNPRCTPPWDLSNAADAKDFRRKVTESIKNPPDQPRGWILNDPQYATFDAEEYMSKEAIAEMIKRSMKPKPAVDSPFDPTLETGDRDAELAFLTRPTGLLGQLCGWINSTGLRNPPLLSLGCSLTFLGALFGHKIKDTMGGRTNLYGMGICDSSGGKNNAMKQIRRLCEAAGCTKLLGGDGTASDSAIESRMAEKPVTLFLWDEIGHALVQMKGGQSAHLAGVVALLMKLYSAADNIYLGREYADADKQNLIKEPCCCVWGTSTYDKFTEGITRGEMNDGWLSRCLLFAHKGGRLRKVRGNHDSPVPVEIVKQVSAWWERNMIGPIDAHNVSQFVCGSGDSVTSAINSIVVETDEDAEKVFIAFDDESERQGKLNKEMDCLWAKAEENARRIALIVAASDNFAEPRITRAIARYACRLMTYLLHDFEHMIVPEIVSGETETKKRQIVKIVENSKHKGVTKSVLTNATKNMVASQRDMLIKDLIEGKDIWKSLDPAKVNKRPATRFHTPEYFVVYQSRKEHE